MNPFYPDIIAGLPEAEIPFQGVRGWLSQAADHQIVFFEIEPTARVSAHKHGAQWGVVFEGEMEMTIGGVNRTYRKGDHYYIPGGILHAARFNQKTWLMDFFDDPDRYHPKSP